MKPVCCYCCRCYCRCCPSQEGGGTIALPYYIALCNAPSVCASPRAFVVCKKGQKTIQHVGSGTRDNRYSLRGHMCERDETIISAIANSTVHPSPSARTSHNPMVHQARRTICASDVPPPAPLPPRGARSSPEQYQAHRLKGAERGLLRLQLGDQDVPRGDNFHCHTSLHEDGHHSSPCGLSKGVLLLPSWSPFIQRKALLRTRGRQLCKNSSSPAVGS